MKKFIPREKLGRKARKQLDGERRATWSFSPVTKKVESKKRYSRKQKNHDRDDDCGMVFLYASRRPEAGGGGAGPILPCLNPGIVVQ